MGTIQATDLNGHATQVAFDIKPDYCPQCHRAIDPRQTGPASIIFGAAEQEGAILEVIFQCTRRECNQFYIAKYRRDQKTNNGQMTGVFHLLSTAPRQYLEPSIPSEVIQISPNFRTIFSQATIAEDSGLDQIAGVGYRKALEYLIKDYCAQKDGASTKAIQNEALGVTIKTRVDDHHIKECAKRAAWLGNDETHYVRRWEDKDIKDLKVLIELTMNWIRSAIMTKRYLESMVETKGPDGAG